MTKKEIRRQSTIKTDDEVYNEVYNQYKDAHNAQSDKLRALAACGDCVCAVREAKLYMETYGDLMPPKLKNILRERIKRQKLLAIEHYVAYENAED